MSKSVGSGSFDDYFDSQSSIDEDDLDFFAEMDNESSEEDLDFFVTMDVTTSEASRVAGALLFLQGRGRGGASHLCWHPGRRAPS
jgi:hypothetical protein